MNFATLLPNSVANSQLVSAVLRYDITVQFTILKIKSPELGQHSINSS